MQVPLIKEILQKKKTCYFISPHFDDAVLSAGALMTYLAQYTNVVVITVFTEAGNRPYTISAKAFLKQCGYTDAKALYDDRQKEDKLVLGTVVSQVLDLGFSDALWRIKQHPPFLFSLLGKFASEFIHVYPTYKLHVSKGNVATADQTIVKQLKRKLRDVMTDKNSVVFCPAGIGRHVDHVLVHTVCAELFPDAVFWSDFPYNQSEDMALKNELKSFTFAESLEKKRSLIEGYKTQFDAMFKNGLTLEQETFYIRS
jgi:LmbE family N-acetylglucosaminyl deacetylase